jgi:hypothetical protein
VSTKAILILFLITTGILSSCVRVAAQTVTSPVPPTTDLNLVRTEAAQTVVAEITRLAALNAPTFTLTSAPPTVTSVPPTIPPTPNTFVLLTTKTLIPQNNPSGWTVYPTKTKTPYTDSGSLESQSVDDGKIVAPGEDITVRWTIKNTGKRPWNSGFYFRPVITTLYPSPSGNQFINGTVNPGDNYDFSILVEAPDKEGIYVVSYVLMNDAGVGFFQFYFSVQVNG